MKATKEERLCVFCRFAREIPERDEMLCKYCGAVSKEYVCRRFVYDPLKRIPRRVRLDCIKLEPIEL